MPKYKSLLKSYEFLTAKKKRHCKHDTSHIICMGEKCLVIYEGEMGRPYPYCIECAREILENAHEAVSCELQGMLS
jgi:hypothetical protein